MMAKTLTLRLLDDEGKQLDKLLKAEPYIKTASKFLINCMKSYPRHIDRIADLEDQVRHLEEKCHVLEDRIEGARSAAALLLEKTGQDDLLG